MTTSDAPRGPGQAPQPCVDGPAEREIDEEERTSQLENREQHLAWRERAVARRERLADRREALADERETAADRREALADEREVAADRREALADEREQRFNELEAQVDAQARTAGISTVTQAQRVMEMIARGRALLAASNASLDRSEAALQRVRTRDNREQAAITRETMAARPDLDQPAPSPVSEDDPKDQRVQVLRRQLLAVAGELVRVEEGVADRYERMAATRSDGQQQHRQKAARARETAQRVRELTAKIIRSESGTKDWTAPSQVT